MGSKVNTITGNTISIFHYSYKMVHFLALLSCAACIASTFALEAEDVKVTQSRQPKLFFVSSSSTTSSFSTSTVCFVSKQTVLVEVRRKRRNILADAIADEEVNIQPDSPLEKEETDTEIESGAEDVENSRRDGRFLLYWLTTTSTSTTTIFTATGTIATLACTPAGYTLSACG